MKNPLDDEAASSYAQITTPKANATSKTSSASTEHPLDSANWLSRLTMWWIHPLLRLGSANPLEDADVWPLPQSDRAHVLQEAFERQYQKEKSVFKAMWAATKRTMVVAIALHIISAAFSMLQPLLIKAVLQYLQQGRSDLLGDTSGYVVAVILTLVTFVGTTALNYGMYLTSRAGMHARMIVVNGVYQKLLRLSSSSSDANRSGDLITLAGVDSERLFEAYSIGLWAIVSPLMIVTVCILIALQMSIYEALAAFGTSICILVYAMTNSRQIGKSRRQISLVSGERMQLTNEMLQGIRAIKLNAWEDAIAQRIAVLRDGQEIPLLRKYNYLRVRNLVMLSLAQVTLVCVCLLVYVVIRGQQLTVPTTFTLLALSNVCKMPFGIFSNAVVFTSEAWASIQRISTFLEANEIENQIQETKADQAAAKNVVEIQEGCFTWSSPTNSSAPEPPSCILDHISLSLPRGSLTMVIGAVGSGKSSLVSAILGEMHRCKGTVIMPRSCPMAFASQTPWIQHASVRDNILFGAESFDADHYAKVIEACQLERDLELLARGDATEIGERGINLSGGQKARVSLARAMYRTQEVELLLFDDPLSALDVHVANAVFQECVIGPLVQSKTRLLVLNAHYHFLPHADQVVVLDHGKVLATGTLEQVQQKVPSLVATVTHHEEPTPLVEDEPGQVVENPTPETTKQPTDPPVPKEQGSGPKKPMMLSEDRATGSVTWRTYASYLSHCGWNGLGTGLLVLVSFALAQVILFAADYYLSFWANGSLHFGTQSTRYGVYVAIIVLAISLAIGRSILFTEICIRCSKALHARYFDKILRAPVPTFFDITPIGRILNRFSRDLDQLDNPLPYYSLGFVMFGMMVLSIFIVCAVLTPYTLILYAPLAYACYRLQAYSQATARELKRLDGITRSPFLNLVSETLNGLETIRAFQMPSFFADRCRALVDANAKFFFSFQTASRWFAMRLDWLVSSIVSVVTFVCVASRNQMGAAQAGIAMTYAIQLTLQFQRLMTLMSMTENYMTSYERLSYYDGLESEEQEELDGMKRPAASDWPCAGAITFENVSVRYRPGLDLVLHKVSFSIHAGEHIGVCGRTGSGKSTLLSALFRIVACERDGGRILIDNVDIATLPLQQLRSKLTIIPQDPVLFSGNLRFNLDPFHQYDDAALWHVVRQVHLDETGLSSLEAPITEKGENVSVGQRQLICIARALLRRNRIVVLDEATANVDPALDRRIQTALKENMGSQTTMLTIAHRLDTILESDRILVMENGQVQEFDTPTALLQQQDSRFKALVQRTTTRCE